MKLPKPRARARAAARERRGVALLLAFLVLIVIVAIVSQIDIMTKTDARVAFNDIALTKMDLAIESAMLEVHEMLAEDAQAAAAAEGAETGGMAPPDAGAGEGAAPGGPGGGEAAAVDSKMDQWARPQGTSVNDLQLRIFIQDEDSKYNVLNMLVEDEEEAERAYERVVEILDMCREGTAEDIDSSDAQEMARVMRDHYTERSRSFLPRPSLLTDTEKDDQLGMPLTLREVVVLEPFEERHFEDYFDDEGERVHSIGSFLTVWTAPLTGEGADPAELPFGEGGLAVNVNTAPAAVLKSLMSPRQIDFRTWDAVIEYRNEEEESEDSEEEEAVPVLDEFGEEIVPTKFFDDLEELNEVRGWDDMQPEAKAEVEALLTVESRVFSIFVTARRETAAAALQQMDFRTPSEREQYERSGTSLMRTVRAVVWRMPADDGVTIVPLIRWEVLSYMPLEVLDLPEDWY